MVESSVQLNHRDEEFHHGERGREGRGRKGERSDQDEDDVPPSDPFLFLFSDPIMKSACCYKKLDKPSIFAGIYTLVSSKNFITISPSQYLLSLLSPSIQYFLLQYFLSSSVPSLSQAFNNFLAKKILSKLNYFLIT